MRSVGGSSHLQSGEMLWRQRWWASCGSSTTVTWYMSVEHRRWLVPPAVRQSTRRPPTVRPTVYQVRVTSRRTNRRTNVPSTDECQRRHAGWRRRWREQRVPASAILATAVSSISSVSSSAMEPTLRRRFRADCCERVYPFAALWATESSKLYRALLPA